MSEELSGDSPSHDEDAAPSPAPDVEVKPEGETEASAAEKPKKSNKVQERINQLTREKYEQRQENADLQKRLDNLESKMNETPKPVSVAPKEDDFDSDSAFDDAKSKHIATLASEAAYDRFSVENKERDNKVQAEQRNKELQTKQEAFKSNVDGKRENFADFEDVAYGHQFMDQDLAEQIFEMDNGPEVAYHLGSHLDVAEKIFALDPVKRARELTKLEMSVQALQPKKVSGAPDPITPLGNSEDVSKSEDDMTDAEWLKWRNDQINARNSG